MGVPAYLGPRFVDGKLDKLFPPSPLDLRRVEHWDRRLGEVFERNHDVPFRYGLFDCLHLCRDAIAATTGHRLEFGYQGLEQSQTFKAAQGGSLVDVWSRLLGPPREGMAGMVDGDIGLVTVLGAALTSVFLFDGRLWGPSVIGFMSHHHGLLVMHWPIGTEADRAAAALRLPMRFRLRPLDPHKVRRHAQVVITEHVRWANAQRAALR